MTQPAAMLNQRQQPAAAMLNQRHQPAATLNQHPTTLDQQHKATTNTRCGNSPFRHSLVILSTLVTVFIGAQLAAAVVAPLGWSAAAVRRHRREDDEPSTSIDRRPALQVAASPQRTPNRTGARE